jgi:cytochrome c553
MASRKQRQGIRSARTTLAILGAMLCLASMSVALAQQPTMDTKADANAMAERVLACAACHGASGRGTDDPYFPRLAGKPAGYLYNQLIAFRNDRRRYPPMNYLLEYLTPDYLKQIAEYYAAQRQPFPPPAAPTVSKAVLEVGDSLVHFGDANRNIPACMSCHGVSLTGQEPGIPSLLGLRAAYISAQLGAWRYGNRTAVAPDCMQVVAGHLTEDDVRAVAAWLAAQPVPADQSPAKANSYSLPFACGSQAR